MSGYRLLKHRQYERNADRLPDSIRRKAMWAQVLLGTRGRTPNVKTTTGYNARWRRTPVQGYHYYLWWIPLSESELAERSAADLAGQTILVHSIRHHDETDDPIDLSSLDEFEEVSLSSLDPRFDEQRKVSRQMKTGQIAPATVKGLPGSGKTVSLFYLVRDLILDRGVQNLLYVTYTSRLKRAAREFLSAQAPALEQHVHILTLTELEKELTGLPTYVDPMAEAADFRRYVDMQPPASIGVWRRYPAALYTELRAHIFGRTFPAGYTLPLQRVADGLFSDGAFDVDAYAGARRLPREDAAAAVRLAERLRTDRFFLDQIAANRALAQLTHPSTGKRGAKGVPGWFGSLDALIVDEVQDLTLLQIALLAELARVRMQANDRHMAVVVAGDESQIVQPSGFDWGVTKDLLREVLGANPQEYEFRHQRRSPRNLAFLIDNAWNFYVRLPKTLRPSANRQSFLDDADMELAVTTHRPDDSEENGRLLICPLPDTMRHQSTDATRRWRTFVEELAELPGRVLIDLTGKVPDLSTEVETRAQEVLFDVREIKGLERNTVIVAGLDDAYQQAMRLTDSADAGPPLFEARRLIDEMRVAISRSTNKLILLERPDAPVLDALAIDNVAGHYTISWESLRDLLRTEQMSEIEVVEGYLDEVDDLIERGRWEQAQRRNRRAYEFAMQMEDRALQREAQSQYIQIFVQEATAAFIQDQLADALRLNRRARTLATELGDPAVIDEADEQLDTLRQALESQLQNAIAKDDGNDLAARYGKIAALDTLVAAAEDSRLQRTLDEARLALGWQWGTHLVTMGPEAGPLLAALFGELASLMARQEDRVGAAHATIVARRYETLPHAAPLTIEQLTALLQCIDDALHVLIPLALEADAFAFVMAWIEECFEQLQDRCELFYDWAVRAERINTLTGYPGLDDRLWDLENRAELKCGASWTTETDDASLLRFGAFVAAYNGNPHDASLAWEKLGEIDLAIHQARDAGELERAYNLMRHAGRPIPDALSTAVKLLRQAAQLISKQESLRDGERRALAEQLGLLLSELEPKSDHLRYDENFTDPESPAEF